MGDADRLNLLGKASSRQCPAASVAGLTFPLRSGVEVGVGAAAGHRLACGLLRSWVWWQTACLS